MPVRRFRSLQEMEDSLWREPGAPLWAAIRGVWAFGARVGNQRFPPGVYKHRSIEAAKALREQWDDTNFRRFRDSRAKGVTPRDLARRVEAWLDDPSMPRDLANGWSYKSGAPQSYLLAAAKMSPGDSRLVVAVAWGWFASCGEDTAAALAAFATKGNDRSEIVRLLRELGADPSAGDWARRVLGILGA